MDHRYCLTPLPLGHPAFVARTPGVRDVLRLFPEPSAKGHGSLGVEGGLTFVAGPGMGRTTLLLHLEAALEAERGIPCAKVTVRPELAAGGFQAFLGALAESARTGLLASPSIGTPEHAALRTVLQRPVPGDVPQAPGALTPRGLQTWIDEVGRAAAQGRGCCLLFDDLDAVASAEWASALVAGLRFTFQSASGITPVFALWTLYFEESLPGSNYFRNVTRPIFVAPLSPAERDALIDLDLAALSPDARAHLEALAGGHPALWQRLLGELASAGDPSDGAALTPDALDLRLLPSAAERRARVEALVRRSPQVWPALRRIRDGAPLSRAALPQALITTGLVGWSADGVARLPAWVDDALRALP